MPAVQVQAWAAVGCPSWLLSGQGAASVEELVSLHDVQAYHRTRCQNSRRLLPRPLLPWSGRRCGVGRLAAQPPLRGARRESAFRRPRPVAPESLGRAGRDLREDSRKGSLLAAGPAVRCTLARQPSRPLSMANADPSVATSSSASALRQRSRLVPWAQAPPSTFVCVGGVGGLGAPGGQLPG